MGRLGAHTPAPAGWLCRCALYLSASLLGICTAARAQEEAVEPAGVAGYMRVDTDKLGTQIWFGATHQWRSTDIASDVYLVGTTAELDVGPVFPVGQYLAVSPMAGLVLDLGATDLTGIAPQFYVYLTAGRWYLESWETAFIAASDEYRPHTFSDRTFLLCSLSDQLALGPHAELSLNLEDTDAASRLTSLALGGAAQLGYGDSNTLLVFAGYETRKDARGGGDGIAGRVTFIREW